MTFRELLAVGKKLLQDESVPDADVDAWCLLEYVTCMDKTAYLMHSDDKVSEKQKESYLQVIKQRAKRVPLQYITGRQSFMGLELRVNPDVLIPRMDTECLVLEAEKYLQPGAKVLDMCTGSGCIAVSMQARNPDIEMHAADISAKALEIARCNADKCEAEVTFFNSDLFSAIQGKYNMIISNPPYIPTKVIEGLMPEVSEYEPRLALDGMEDGLEFYRRIIHEAGDYLLATGMLFFETGCEQAETIKEIMEDKGYRDCRIVRDLAGLNRIVYGGK